MEITGRITADAQVRTVKGERKVVGFSIAINDSYKTKEGEQKKVTTFVDCSYWKQPDVAQYLKKGAIIGIDGRIGTNAWTDKQGNAHASITFHVNNLKFYGSSNSTARVETSATVSTNEYSDNKDDLPF
jgi:single-strand DNA-binding protein